VVKALRGQALSVEVAGRGCCSCGASRYTCSAAPPRSSPYTSRGCLASRVHSWAAVGRSSGYSSVILFRSPRVYREAQGGSSSCAVLAREKTSHSGPAGKSQKMCSPNES